jgi:hypothetical protein
LFRGNELLLDDGLDLAHLAARVGPHLHHAIREALPVAGACVWMRVRVRVRVRECVCVGRGTSVSTRGRKG